jgi:hypothetical protein
MFSKKFIELWHRVDAIIGAFLVLGATFGSGMAIMSLLDNSERQGLYTQIETTRANTERQCNVRLEDMQRNYVDPGGPTQRLITELKGRVDEQSNSLAAVGKSCEKAAQVSKDTQAKVAAPLPSVRAAAAAAAAAATNAAQKQNQEATRAEVNRAIIDRKTHRP